MAWDRKVPFTPFGDMLDWVHGPEKGYDHRSNAMVPIVWVDNCEFFETLKYVGHGKGRSSVTFEFERPGGCKVTVFSRDADEILSKMVFGKIRGIFTYVKRGANFGCKLVRHDPLAEALDVKFNEAEANVPKV